MEGECETEEVSAGEITDLEDEEDDHDITRVKMKIKTGRTVAVYDGRKWPVINCGNVIVSPEERVSDVKSSIVSGNISKDKRKKSSKYALAIASSFGHVHAFLQDGDYVLDKIDQTTAEEKCLMLIKKPKSSSRKMFKSQSWANLSLSDSHLYNQPNYGTEGRKHKYRMKRKPSDLQTVPCESMSNLTDYGLRVDSYIPQQREIKNYNRCNGVASPKSCHSEDLSGRGTKGEINNNKLAQQSGGRMYSSHMDIYRNAPKLSYIQENSDKCVLRSDEMYSDKSDRGRQEVDSDSVSRAHSVGDLSTGLTLSVVGQRKADSVHNLNITKNAGFKPVSTENGNLKKSDSKLFSPTELKKSTITKKCIQNKNDLQNTLRDLLTNISEKEKEAEKTPRMSSANEKRDSNQTPVKPKRSLPNVPQGQANDRKKHYTEVVKQRMSQHSRSGGHSSSSGTSSSVRTVQDSTPLDKEVSDLLGQERESCPGMLENVPYSENGSITNGVNHSSHTDSLNVSIPSSLRSCDSGQATVTSLSSTVDSGYLTNDAENDMYSSSSYMKSLQRSAQNLYSKKVPLGHSQSMYQESPRKQGHLHKDSAMVKGQVQNGVLSSSVNERHETPKTGTFPRSSQVQGQAKDFYQVPSGKTLPQESQKPKPPNCDNKLVKYSSMKNLTTSEFSPEGQRSQGQNKNVGNVKRTPVKSEHFFQHVQSPESRINQEPMKQNDIKPLNSLPLTSPPKVGGQPTVIESHYNTLPGNWKFQNSESMDDTSGKRVPSLFQLSQTHRILPVALTVGLEFNLLDHIKLCENCVKLQNARKSNKRESTAMSPPQGKYARLGGPGSAFTPVKVTNTSVYTVTMVTDVSAVFLHKNLCKGDIIIEVNNKFVLGETQKSIETILSNSSDEVLLTVARASESTTSGAQTDIEKMDRLSSNNNSVPLQEKSSSNIMDTQVDHLKKQVARLTLELKRKTKAIRELNSLLPWRPNEEQSEINGNNEITLNGLSEDEFIV